MKDKVLMIDDDEEMCEEMAEILKDEGYEVKIAFDGLEGKRLAERYNCDILLLDLKLSGLNGREVLKSVKEKKPKLKVLVLTGSPLIRERLKERNDEDENIYKEEDILRLADGIINKPFKVEIVLGKIRELLVKARA